MANIHMLIGFGEGLATGLIVLAVFRTRPRLAAGFPADASPAPRGLIGYGLLVCIGLAVFVAPFASPWPDGLEKVAESMGFQTRALENRFPAPLPDYAPAWIGSATLATAVAGLVGTGIAFAAAYGLARVLVPVLSVGKKDGRD